MPTPPDCFVTLFDLTKAEKLKQILIDQEFELSSPQYTLFSGKKKGISCTLYSSGKLMVQGKNSKEFIEFILEPEILERFEFGYTAITQNLEPHIGIDESGKGDFFGPLCVAGVYADKEGIEGLQKLKVRDSKTLSDDTIQKLAQKIRKNYLHHVLRVYPKKYNELYAKFGNLNLLLGWGHALIAGELVEKSQCRHVTIDQFAKEGVVIEALRKKKLTIELTQRPRAEEDLVVAAASILARAAFIEGMEILGEEIGKTLPKGASEQVIKTGKSLVHLHGREILEKLGKLHFKTLDKILEDSL